MPDPQEYTEILYSASDHIATIVLNRPEKRNALDYRLRRELVDALRRAEADDEVSVVLIEGAGPSFCSGYDMAMGPDAGPPPEGWVSSAHYDGWTDQFARSCLRDWLTIWDLLKPVVAKVHGHCIAGGTELMSMCDIAFVADDAVIGYPPMRGMTTPDVPYFPWKMTMARAKYLQLTGNTVTGKEAAAMGWVAKSFPADQLDDAVKREVRPMAQIAPDLLAANKAELNEAYEVMGMRTALQRAWQWHSVSQRLRPRRNDFGQAMREGGLRAAIEWRDGPFRREGFPM
ncbi:MAG TPA: enoyl-CoA hydratase-related protein [Acidimicrobiales bacterium]|nr:enoyl-CoA hydratase-related protein [Acidimicrobiales bacterium]